MLLWENSPTRARVGLDSGEGGERGEHGGWRVIHARRRHWEDPASAVVSHELAISVSFMFSLDATVAVQYVRVFHEMQDH